MMKLSDYTKDLLADIEKRIDPAAEEDLVIQHEKFWNGTCEDIIFQPSRKEITAPGIEVKKININDALHDYELMLDAQLAKLSDALNSKCGLLGMRANYGTGIMTSLFGAEIFVMPRETNTLPTTYSFNDSDAIRRILDKGIPELTNGFGKDVFNFGELCAEVFRDYPKISKYVQVYHPDAQGTVDIAELLWGTEMFYEMYDDPDFVQDVMRLITDTYIKFMNRWFQLFPARDGLNFHWEYMAYPGKIVLRDDSAMNLSPELYKEFALQYDQELLEYYGGGCVHFCGRGDHYIEQLAGIEKLAGINMSQPMLNDMDKIFSTVLANNKKILGLGREACEAYSRREDAVPGMISTW